MTMVFVYLWFIALGYWCYDGCFKLIVLVSYLCYYGRCFEFLLICDCVFGWFGVVWAALGLVISV